MIINSANIRTLEQHVRAVILEGYNGEASGIQPRVCMPVSSMSAEERYTWLGAMPGMREFIGDRQVKNLSVSDWGVKNRKWEDTIGIPREAVERDTYGTYKPFLQEMGVVGKQQPDDLMWEMLVNGFTRLCYTGKPFFGANHHQGVNGDKGKFTNFVTKKFSRANFRIGRQNLLNRKNTEGRSMKLGRKLLLIVSPTYETEAWETVVADKLSNDANNPDKGKAELFVSTELGALSEHAWFLLELGRNIKPLVFQDEVPFKITTKFRDDDDNVFDRDEYVAGAYARNNVGYMLPELAYGSTGANDA